MTVRLMVDIETVGVSVGSGILSIAAVPFDRGLVPVPVFYIKIAEKSLKDFGFKFEAGTLAWWARQDPEVKAEAFSGTTDVQSALYAFSEYVKHFGEPVEIWGNGSNFDNVLLAAAYDKVVIERPWNFTFDRCYRTLKSLAPQIKFVKPAGAHHALHDAKAQATHAEQILEWLRGANDDS